MFIKPLYFQSVNCIGLYQVVFTRASTPNRTELKVLKFTDKVYLFSEHNHEMNLKQLARFEIDYKALFTHEELENLKSSFLKGNIYKGSYF